MRKLKGKTFTGTREGSETQRERDGRKIARRAAAEGIVLLKNDGNVLPLVKNSRIALYGRGAVRTIKGGTGSGDVNERSSVSILQGMKDAGYDITTEKKLLEYDHRFEMAREAWRDEILRQVYKGQSNGDFFNVYVHTFFTAPEEILPDVEALKKNGSGEETALYILSRVAGEGADRFNAKGDYLLTDNEHAMLEILSKAYRSLIVILNTGGPVDLSFMDEFPQIQGLLQMGQAGMEGGHALADILSGNVNPSGRLTDTWALHYADYPEADAFSHNNDQLEKEEYKEGIYVGYRYFDSYEIHVRYGFGYGLSYTAFSVEREEIRWAQKSDPTLELSVAVTNTGEVSGKEVVQIYASLPAGELEKEYRRLVAFAKTSLLGPGEKERLTLSIPLKSLSSYREKDSSWIMEQGSYGFWIGNDLENSRLSATLSVDREMILEKDQAICPLQQELSEYERDPEVIRRQYDGWRRLAKEKNLPEVILNAGLVKTREIIYQENAHLTDPEVMAFTERLTEEQLIRLSCGELSKEQGSDLGAAGMSVPGSAGETSHAARKEELASIVLADGPAGLRLMQYYFVRDGRVVPMPFQFSLENGYFCPDAEQTEGDRYNQYCTAIPTGTVLAQTWNTDLIVEVGEMIGREMEFFGVTLWLAPGMNIHRNPLCGRNFEYYSEDPVLAGRMAAAMTTGVQKIPGRGTTIKHFACNNAEDSRMSSDSVLSERTLRESYLRGFEIAVKESQPMAMMTSYNLINGIHAANHADLCTKVARCEWGFRGLIMTDWTTTMVDEKCTASGCMRAGNDLVMPGAVLDHENLKKELVEGTLSTEDLKACVSRIVSIIWQSGEYEDAKPYGR